MNLRSIVGRKIHARSLRDLGWLVSGSGASQAMGLVSMVCMARIFTPVELGEFFFIQSWLTALSGWGLPGLSTSLVSSVARGEGGTFRRAVWLESMAALGGSACLVGLGVWFDNNQTHLGLWTYAMAAFLFPISINDCGLQALAGRRLYHQVSAVQVASRMLNLLWLLLCAINHIGIAWFFGAQLLTTCAINVFLIASNWNHVGPKNDCNPEAIRYGIHLTFSNAIQQPMSQAERLLVGFFLGSANLAVFGLGEMIYNNLRTLANLSQSFYYPRLVHLSDNRVYLYLSEQAKIWTGCFIGLALLFAVVLPLVYPPLLGEQYEESARFAVYYSVAFAVGVPNFFVAIYLRHLRATKVTYIYGLLRAPLSLCCLFVSFSVFGVFGLPFGRGLANVGYAFVAFLLIKYVVERSILKTQTRTDSANGNPNLRHTSTRSSQEAKDPAF
jgi:O-antigen/teichoic acid export membrane protein